MGQGWSEAIAAGIQAGVAIYQTEAQKEMAEDRLEFQEDQAAKAAAREAEAQRIQQELVKANQQSNTAAAAASAAPIMGMQPAVFYTAAGLGVGVLVLVGMFLTRGK